LRLVVVVSVGVEPALVDSVVVPAPVLVPIPAPVPLPAPLDVGVVSPPAAVEPALGGSLGV
jgi:hypothetical protein